MPGNQLYDDPNLAQFYDRAHRQRDDYDFCKSLAANARSVLDLGCGTGELTVELARGRQVTGVDPAAAMLDIARDRSGGDRVNWVEADARTIRLPRRFDLVVLTGHAFQVFLTRQDQIAALKTIAAHLNPGGQFVFDSRNPDLPAPKSRDRLGNGRTFDHTEIGPVEGWNESRYDPHTNVLTYVNGYRVLRTGEDFSARAQILYTPQDRLAEMIGEAGLQADQWLGDWLGNDFHLEAAEIIPIGSLA